MKRFFILLILTCMLFFSACNNSVNTTADTGDTANTGNSVDNDNSTDSGNSADSENSADTSDTGDSCFIPPEPVHYSTLTRQVLQDESGDIYLLLKGNGCFYDQAGKMIADIQDTETCYNETYFTLIQKINSSGDEVWIAPQPQAQNSQATISILLDRKDNLIIIDGVRAPNIDAKWFGVRVTKTTPSNEKIWAKEIPLPVENSEYNIISGVSMSGHTDKDNNIYIVGRLNYGKGSKTDNGYATEGDGNGHAFVIKMKSDGEILWSKQWHGMDRSYISYILFLLEDGTPYLAGTVQFGFNDKITGNGDIFLIKLDENGNDIWINQWGSTTPDRALTLSSDSQHNVVITGRTEGDLAGHTPSGDVDSFIIKVTPQGNIVWQKQWSAIANGTQRIQDGLNDMIYLYGQGVSDVMPVGDDKTSLFLIQMDGKGDWKWHKSIEQNFAKSYDDFIGQIDKESIFFLSSFQTNEPPESEESDEDFIPKYDCLLYKLDSSGKEIWKTQWGGENSGITSLRFDAQNNLLLLGATGENLDGDAHGGGCQYEKEHPCSSLFFTKMAPDGTLLFTKQWGSGPPKQ